MNIPIARTYLLDDEINSVLEPLKSGWLVQGKKVKEFEQSWCEFTKSKNSIAVTSCTSALYLSLAALGFGPGDEAIVPAFTWISTANVIEHLGGKVKFCDIELDNFNINFRNIEKLITDKTKAILPVHLFGKAANMKSIIELANRYKLWVVEDAACGFGSQLEGLHVGNFGDTGCFSFHPRKAITTGEGGMITTNNDKLAEKLRILRDHGASTSDLQRHLGPKPFLLSDHPFAGFNLRMTDIQAALGVAQMSRAKSIIQERRNIASRYSKYLSDVDWIQLPNDSENHLNGYQSYPCLFEPDRVKKALSENNFNLLNKINQERNNWMEYLQSKGISTSPATHAVHMLKYYKNKYNLENNSFPVALAANNCSVSLPLFNGMSEEEQDYVIKIILSRFE